MLFDYGWSADRADKVSFALTPPRAPARVLARHRDRYILAAEAGEVSAVLPGRLIGLDAPVVGDFVAITQPAGDLAVIETVLARDGLLSRREPGGAGVQSIAANVDLAVIATSANADFNPRRLERYATAAWRAGAQPLIVLTKADLLADATGLLAEARAAAPGVDALAVSLVDGRGLDAIRAAIRPGRTAALLGMSGVGKSSLLNALMGEELMATGGIRDDDARGRHTTTHRQLFRLPWGGLMIDSPGMREFGLVDADDGLSATFSDVETLFERCRFHDCRHGSEPGCAVRSAIADGSLPQDRWRAYEKLQRETAFEARRTDPALQSADKALWAKRSKNARARDKAKRGGWAGDD